MSGAQNWQALGVGNLYGQNAVLEQSGAGFTGARDGLDYARLGSPGRTPEAQYPDGYIGTRTGSKVEDPVLDKIGKLNSRSYTRGVHRGERQDPGDYVWPSSWNPERGLQSQARGMRTGLASGPPPRLVRGGNDAPRGDAPVTPYMVPDMRGISASLLPPWR